MSKDIFLARGHSNVFRSEARARTYQSRSSSTFRLQQQQKNDRIKSFRTSNVPQTHNATDGSGRVEAGSPVAIRTTTRAQQRTYQSREASERVRIGQPCVHENTTGTINEQPTHQHSRVPSTAAAQLQQRGIHSSDRVNSESLFIILQALSSLLCEPCRALGSHLRRRIERKR